MPIFAVADGMGGHLSGDLASEAVVRRLDEGMPKMPAAPQLVEQALERASADMDVIAGDSELGMGTTVVSTEPVPVIVFSPLLPVTVTLSTITPVTVGVPRITTWIAWPSVSVPNSHVTFPPAITQLLPPTKISTLVSPGGSEFANVTRSMLPGPRFVTLIV